MIVSPSLLSANFGNLADDIAMLNNSEADWLHLDVMDGVFVPNISFGFPVMQSIKKLTNLPLDVHLMITNPIKFVNEVKACGAEYMTVHYEACDDINATINAITQCGMKVGVSIKPDTPVDVLTPIIERLDLVLVMSVNPGFGGQSFMPNSLERVTEVRRLIEQTGSKAIVEVDGGVNAETGKLLAQAGAQALVAGSYVFKASDPHQAISTLKSL